MSRFESLSPSQFGGFGETENPDAQQSANVESFLAESPITPNGKSGRRIGQDQTVLPVTIKQLLNSPEPTGTSTFKIDGKEVSNIKIVGQIESVDIQTTYNEYAVNDGTGTIPIKVWKEVDDAAATAKEDNLNRGAYVTAVGRVQFFNNSRTVTVQKLVPVKDFNLVSYHILETIYVHKANTDPSKQRSAASLDGTDVYHTGGSGSVVNGSDPLSIFDETEHLTYEQKEILNFFKRDQTESGPHISTAYKAFPQFSAASIRENINYMVMEGLLYGTIDDDHLKPT